MITIKQIIETCPQGRQSVDIQSDGLSIFCIHDWLEPKEMILARGLSDALLVFQLIQEAYNAGKKGEELVFEKENKSIA